MSELETSEEHPNAILKNLWMMHSSAREREIDAKIQKSGEAILTKISLQHSNFAMQILNLKLRQLEESDGMKVHDRHILDSQNLGPHFKRVVFQHEREKLFWDACLKFSKKNHPVCGIGNPGIDKPTATLCWQISL